ncbi:MAG TPA: PBP1A family penicillin-binding protein [Syntrophorhabdaceae bacterium]|nr:PBP1A family penicillin-binding protein [Syntrophorhabdaceae bacterium]HOG40413.1 PBP1A family penicillin-binding protein [Syntrophorhabdaceae bacterium]
MKKRLHLYLVFLVVVSVCFLAVGYGIYIIKDIPSIKVLKNLENKPASSIFDANGQLIYLIVPDNRIFVQYSKIPKHVKMAFLAAEDADFFKHGAVEFQSLIRALLKNVIYGKVVQGGSTITQQVIKTLILGPERSLLRKAREAILAYKLERYLTKKDILNLYLNNIYMGHGVYGVEAASQIYFGKHVWEITTAEAALLAGIVQAPSRNTPKRNPGNARIRQEYVINQMFEKNMINEKTKKVLLNDRISIREDNGVFTDSYFKDFVFQYVEEKYGKGVFSRKRLQVYATVDSQFQRLAEEAVRRGLSQYEQRKGEYTVSYSLDKRKWDDFMKTVDRNLKLSKLLSGKTYNVLISERVKDGYSAFIGSEKAILAMEDFPFKPGDVVKAIYNGQDKKKLHKFQPVRTLKVEGALLCMDVDNGYVLAMVGGRDFEKSPYNRAVFARLQSGSAFKPFIYATALKKGYDIDSVIPDEPRSYPGGPGGGAWTPRNYDGKYEGQITIKDAVAYSKNAATVSLLQDVGINAVKETIAELGINTELPNNLSIALGSSNLTLLDLVKGFSAFANGGYRIKPIMIRKIVDSENNVLEENGTEKHRALPEEIAQKMNILLKGPVEYGTAKGASRIGFAVAGKTGTTSNYYDALFVGYSPHIATGVWVGFDARTTLGKGESGARVCLPIWMNFMASALRRYPSIDFGAQSEPVAPGHPEEGLKMKNENLRGMD